jgi:hypothetical protein
VDICQFGYIKNWKKKKKEKTMIGIEDSILEL